MSTTHPATGRARALATTVTLVLAVVVALETPALAAAPVPERAAGADRISTAVEVSRAGWTASEAVVIARADDPADALAGSSLAGLHRAPLLITPTSGLTPAAAAEVSRLGATRAFVLGGPAALSEQVVRDLEAAGVDTVDRVAGPDRFSTAARIGDRLGADTGGTVLIVGAWPDALGVAGIAASQARAGSPWPVLLASTSVPGPTADALAALQPSQIIVAGGPAAVSDGVVEELRKRYRVDRVGGADRFETSLRLAQLRPRTMPIVAATGAAFPDGLSAGPYAAQVGGTLLLVPREGVPTATLGWLVENDDVPRLVVVGGSAAVTVRTAGAVWGALLGRGPSTIAPAGAGAVRVTPGQDLASVVASHPAGTTFVIASGRHRLASTVVRAGDRFVGEDGAVLSGARDLSAGAVAWTASSGRWYVGGQTQQGNAPTSVPLEDGGNPRDRHPEELFVDGQRWRHVGSTGELGPGRWHFDYGADRIWIGQDPASLGRIETSVSPFAFSGGTDVNDVTIENLTIERYASETRRGAIDGRNASGWTIRNVTVRDAHGVGIVLGPGSLLEGSLIAGTGQLGLRALGEFLTGPREGQRLPTTIAHNELRSNGELSFQDTWEAGAMKLSRQEGLVFVDNHVHDNRGAGVWVDVDSRDVVIASNLVERNTAQGILYEISERALILWNAVRDNGDGSTAKVNEAGIFVSNSADVDVVGNLLVGNPSGVIARSAGDRDPLVADLHVDGNDVQVAGGRSGINIDRGDTVAAYTSRGNRFTRNTYRLDDPDDRAFLWADDSAKTAAQWRSYGQDVDGRFLDTSAPGTLPVGAIGFSPGAVGAR